MQRILSFLLFGACVLVSILLVTSAFDDVVLSSEEKATSSSVQSTSGISSLKNEDLRTTAGVPYALFTPRSFAVERKAVLFFGQKDDPFFPQYDAFIRTLVASGSLRMPTYRIDFPTSTGARFTFGVVVPDTFVLVGADHQRISSLIHPTLEELRQLLTSQ